MKSPDTLGQGRELALAACFEMAVRAQAERNSSPLVATPEQVVPTGPASCALANDGSRCASCGRIDPLLGISSIRKPVVPVPAIHFAGLAFALR